MSPHAAPRRAALLALLALTAFLISAGEPARKPKANPAGSSGASAARPAQKAPAAAATPQRQQALQQQQRELQKELAKLKRELSAREATRSDARDALANSEIAISQGNRRLHELAAARARLEQQITMLKSRERAAADRQQERIRQFDLYVRTRQELGLRNPFRLLLAGDDPNRPGRESVYLAYLTRDSEAWVLQLGARRQELASLQSESEEKREELAKLAEDELRSRELLEGEQIRRKRALELLSKTIASQQQSIARLERDDQRLGALIDQLSRLLAEQARREAERTRRQAEREATARQARLKPGTTNSGKSEPPRPQVSTNKSVTGANFAELKGKLILPVQGTVTTRYGAPRRGDGEPTGPTWKGVFIRAAPGTEVRSVGSGQIVFADWLRGFGNLLVIDHGDGFLSVYGNNETLLRSVGDRVAVGDVVASVGNTGGSETPGLYFELRFQGRPFDPLTWVAAR